MTGTCTRCHRHRNLARRDLCRPCYQALWKAGTLPPAPLPPEQPTSCTHNGRHVHGTRIMYVADRCRCTPCRAANVTEQKRSALAVRQGRPGLVDPTEVVEHLARLSSAGMGLRQVAQITGVSRSALSEVRRREHDRVSRDTAARILAVRAPIPAAQVVVDGLGTRRRLQALVAIGWPIAALAKHVGTAHRILQGYDVHEGTRAAVALLYVELSNTPPEAVTGTQRASVTRARRHAQARGWAPPIAWDDDTIDDPAATPQGVPDEPEHLTVAARVAELLDIGCSITEIPSRVGARDLNQVLGAIRDPHLKAELRRRAA